MSWSSSSPGSKPTGVSFHVVMSDLLQDQVNWIIVSINKRLVVTEWMTVTNVVVVQEKWT